MLQARYFSPDHLTPYLSEWKKKAAVSTLGTSVCGRPIDVVQLGTGPINVLMWSQMHGNESTTTRALMKLMPWLCESAQEMLLSRLCLHIIPQLNPDGAAAYTRENANGIDLNRDAVALSQPESQCLRNYFDTIQPQFCFNLHDQRTLYGAGGEGNPATLSFLAPAADEERSLTPARERAMQLIASIVKTLEGDLPQAIGRFDDTFNPNCVGDTFAALKVPTLLFEAGHFPEDYGRHKTTIFVTKALQQALIAIAHNVYEAESVAAYFAIPDNQKVYFDVLLKGVRLNVEGKTFENQCLTLQYSEQLLGGQLHFLPQMVAYSAEPPHFKFHKTISLSSEFSQIELPFKMDEILKNPQFTKLLATKS